MLSLPRMLNLRVSLGHVAVFSLLTAIAGCSSQPLFQSEQLITTAHVLDSSLKVDTANGAIRVRRADRSDVQISAILKSTSQERLAAAKVVAERINGGELQVRVEWPDGRRQSREGCQFEIEIPSVSAAHLTTSNGSVNASGLSGLIHIVTSNGKVEVVDQFGPVEAETSNGSVNLSSIDGPINIDTSNGRVTIDGAASSINASSSNGSITVKLADNAVGPVVLDTSNGAVSLDVGVAFGGTLSASTSNGGIEIGSDLQSAVRERGKSNATLEFAGGSGESSIRTSNGRVTIQSLQY